MNVVMCVVICSVSNEDNQFIYHFYSFILKSLTIAFQLATEVLIDKSDMRLLFNKMVTHMKKGSIIAAYHNCNTKSN